jgi:hypothetical protein
VTDSITADGLVVINNRIECLSVSAALDGLEAGDEVGLVFTLDAVGGATAGILLVMLDFQYK